MTPICFVDTETTGVHPGRLAWEIAVIRVDDTGRTEHIIQIEDIDLSAADPFGLRIGKFYDRHGTYAPIPPDAIDIELVTELDAAVRVEQWTRGAHIVGAVPNFDTETLDPMLRRHGLLPAWHYHLIDVEALAVGYLAGTRSLQGLGHLDALPWKSDDISRLCGVEPPAEHERHTALGDARWAEKLYNAITAKVAA